MASLNPYGLEYVRTLGSSSVVYADGITPFRFSTGFSGWKNDIAAIDNTQAQTDIVPEYIINGGTTTNYLPTFGVIDSFIYNGYTQNGYQTLPAVNYLLNTPVQSGTNVTVNVITDPFAIFKVQCDAPLGLDRTALFKYFRIGSTGTAYTSTNASYSALGAVFPGGDTTSSTGISKGVLLSASKTGTYNNAAANSVLVRVIGLADGEIWYDATNPSTDSSYNSVLVQLVNSAIIKPGSPN